MDGTQNQAGLLTKYCDLHVLRGGQEQVQRFFITNLGRDQAILGYPWLRHFNPGADLDWAKGTLKGSQIVVETTSRKYLSPALFIERLPCAFQESFPEGVDLEEGDEVVVRAELNKTTTATQWAAKAQQGKEAPPIPEEYL